MLNISSNEEYKFATKKCYVIDSQTEKDKYNQNSSIKFKAESINSSLCDYSDAFILVTGDITVNAGSNTFLLHLKIVHHFLHARQKLMRFLLMKQVIFILQCLCTI